MSDRSIAKNRFHKGMSAYLRVTLRKVGVSLDEEMAQFVLGGVQPFMGEPDEFIKEVVNDTFALRRDHMKTWEEEHPGKNPYPPSFPERALKLVHEAMEASYEEDGNPTYVLERLKLLCENELSTDPTTTEDPEES